VRPCIALIDSCDLWLSDDKTPPKKTSRVGRTYRRRQPRLHPTGGHHDQLLLFVTQYFRRRIYVGDRRRTFAVEFHTKLTPLPFCGCPRSVQNGQATSLRKAVAIPEQISAGADDHNIVDYLAVFVPTLGNPFPQRRLEKRHQRHVAELVDL
jgi:hypothetical protein